MYLKHIKLAGFKSFVDPTTIPVRGHLNAIVGPNGCGKSNIVDAIRWVIGETSAKQLRGQSMTDVIFNGTSGRKPLGRAMVELNFDNSAGRVVGEFAKFSEIVIRREVHREGQSSYYLNDSHCRRRDIVDIFLGTGLGPRSYSIIEQGMISKLIEAKPEELRHHLEEVAGISKYKERRRETENRLRHTQENLDRLADVRDALDKQLRHLKRQANAAERYTTFKQEERTLSAQIKALQWQQFEAEREAHQKTIHAYSIEKEQHLSKQRDIETLIVSLRVDTEASRDQQQGIQKEFYTLGENIARIEQTISHTEHQIKTWETDQAQTKAQYEALSLTHKDNDQQCASLALSVTELAPQKEALQASAEQTRADLAASDAALRTCQAQYQSALSNFSTLQTQEKVLETNITHFIEKIHTLKARQTRAEQEKEHCDLNSAQGTLAHTKEIHAEADLALQNAKHELQANT
jgi:chromosome segregation protein